MTENTTPIGDGSPHGTVGGTGNTGNEAGNNQPTPTPAPTPNPNPPPSTNTPNNQTDSGGGGTNNANTNHGQPTITTGKESPPGTKPGNSGGTINNTSACPIEHLCVPTLNVPEQTRSYASESKDTESKETIAGLKEDADKIDKIICSTVLVDDILKLDENVLGSAEFTDNNPESSEKFKELKDRLNNSVNTFEPMTQEVQPLKLDTLTEKLVNGKGSFDVILSSVYNHLDNLRKNNLITPQEFARIYGDNIVGILEIASSHIVNMEQSYWQNQLTREQVISTKLANLEAQAKVIALPLVLEQQYAQTQLANRQVDLTTVQIEAERLKIPQIQAQTLGIIEQNRLTKAQWHKTAKEAKLVDATILETKAKIKLMAEQIKKEKANLDLIKAQVAEAYSRIALVGEQIKAAKAQYSDTIDGKPVRGIIGTQNALHRKQSLSYDRDSLYKVLSLQSQGWQTKKTADIGTKSPAVFTAASIDGMVEQYLGTYYNNSGEQYTSLGTGSTMTANGNGSSEVFGRVNITQIKPINGYSDYVTDAEMDSEKPTNVGNTGITP